MNTAKKYLKYISEYKKNQCENKQLPDSMYKEVINKLKELQQQNIDVSDMREIITYDLISNNKLFLSEEAAEIWIYLLYKWR